MFLIYQIIITIIIILSPIILLVRILKKKEHPKRFIEKFCINLKPQQSKIINIPLIEYLNSENYKIKNTSDYYLNVYAFLINDKNLVSSGHMMAKEQMEIHKSKINYIISDSPKLIKTKLNDNLLQVYNENIQIVFDNISGELKNYIVNQKEFIKKSPHLNFWRAPIDNDYGNDLPGRSKEWKFASNNRSLKSFNYEILNNNMVEVIVKYNLPNINSSYTTIFLINPDGVIKVFNDFQYRGKLSDAEMPRFGMNFQIPNIYNNVSWYGRGPHENYIDRKDSAFMGIYKSSVGDLGFDYSRPQENGYRTETKWLKLTDENGIGLEIFGEPSISFSAHNNTIEDFDDGIRENSSGEELSSRSRIVKKQRKPIDVPKRDFISLNIDLKQMGIGGDNSWGARPLIKYLIQPGNFKYSFIIKPILKSEL